MALTSQQFAAELRSMVAKRRAFWEHPWIQKFRRAELSKEQVRHWIEQQFYLTGRVHDLIGPLYVNCEDAEARVHILDNLIEEETGRMSKSAPHPELYLRLGCALGSTRETMLNIRPLPESVALRTWWVWTVAHRPFAEGLAAVSVAGEAQVPGAGNEFARILEEKYGLTHEQTAFWWVHEEADREHGGSATELVSKLAKTDAEQQRVRDVVDHTLELLWRFFDGLELAYGLQRKAA
ncbi:MAG: iron-containing redox enzyme family protein [Thermodesulfobacteriota bacterium]|jgi:pyrroloquinoline-quinone synthase